MRDLAIRTLKRKSEPKREELKNRNILFKDALTV